MVMRVLTVRMLIIVMRMRVPAPVNRVRDDFTRCRIMRVTYASDAVRVPDRRDATDRHAGSRQQNDDQAAAESAG